MKRGSLSLLLAVVAALVVLPFRAWGPELLQDTDTAVLLDAVSKRGNPFSWFAGDWPLGNHFYRPVSTLVFELDYRLYGDDSSGYGWTNAFLASVCVILTYFSTKVWTSNPWIGTTAAWLMTLWLLPIRLSGDPALLWAAAAVLLISAARQLRLWPGLLAAAGIWLLGREIGGQSALHFRIVDWLPGRTASVMTDFALASIALFVGHLQSRRRSLAPPTPFDIPATKSTTVMSGGKNLLPWAGVTLLAALASYEQAMTVPFILLGAWILLSPRRKDHGKEWMLPVACLLLYVALRAALVPLAASGYQSQQFRSGPGVWLAISDYLLPGYRNLQSAWIIATSGPSAFALPELYFEIFAGLSGTVLLVYLFIRYRNQMGMWLWPASLIAFLPMAWLKPFDHYHLFPMALRAGFVAWLAFTVGTWIASAVSPRPRQAPPRSDPAPGSLPHP